MFAIDDFGRPSRRASSLGPTRLAVALGQDVEDPRRPRDGRSERIGLRRRAGVEASPVRLDAGLASSPPFATATIRPPPRCRPRCMRPASRMDRVQHIDFVPRRSAYCSTYRQSFSMLDGLAAVKRRTPVSRFRSIAPAVGLILVIIGLRHGQPRPSPRRSRLRAGIAPRRPPASRPHRRRRPPPAPSQAFKGVNVNMLTFNGPQVAEPLQRRAPDFEALTGAHINVDGGRLPGHLRQGDAGRVDRRPTASTRSCSTRSGSATSSARATWRT